MLAKLLSVFLLVFHMNNVIAGAVANISDSAYVENSEFSCQFSLGKGETSLRVFTLSPEVYACMKQSEFRDVRLVNSLNQPVPFTRFSQDVRRKKQGEKTLTFYQEPELTAFKTKDQIRRLSTLAGVSARRDNSRVWDAKNALYSAILVDVPKSFSADEVLSELLIDMNITAPATAAMVVVERSNDLTTWTTVASPKKIIFVDNGVKKLRDGRIVINRNVQGRYLRIAVLSNLQNATKNIASVTAIYETLETISPTLQWQGAVLQPLDKQTSEWVATLPSYLPVSAMRMRSAEGIVYYQGRFFSDKRVSLVNAHRSLKREGKKKLTRVIKQAVQPRKNLETPLKKSQKWQYVDTFSEYFSQDSAQEKADVSAAAIISFPIKNSRHWKLKFDQPASLNQNQLPIIDFGWQAETLVFLAQGESPFTLLVGSENSQGVMNPISFPSDVLRPANQREPAQPERVDIKRISTPDVMNSVKKIEAEKIPWLTMLLWLILLAGIALMGFMSYQLAKKMKQDQ
jgi:hypothetical protein